MSECPRCAELAREAEQATADGDHSKAVDCRILIKRHPTHDPREEPKAAPRAQARKVRG